MQLTFKNITVLGSGIMGHGIAQVAATAGCKVALRDIKDEFLDNAMQKIPFWNLIREDVYEEVVILTNDDGVCYAESKTQVPKTISDCTASAGDTVTIKYGRDLAWAVIVE